LFDGQQKGIPVLSLVGVLNDEYEGGELTFFDDYKLDLKQGDVVVFPSCFLYPHKVNEITKGTRYSLVSWAW
jgi:predicted 2-oxoglutarate/Fe(II)-dependent dioxygenase YbiX